MGAQNKSHIVIDRVNTLRDYRSIAAANSSDNTDKPEARRLARDQRNDLPAPAKGTDWTKAL